MIRKKFSDQKDYEGWFEIKEEEETDNLTVLETGEMLEQRLDHIPDKRTNTYKQWKKDVNSLIEKYNQMVGFKAYLIIK